MNVSPPRDPAGLLARSPELVRLCARAPALRRAVERGRPHDAYRALFWAHLLRKLGDLAPVAATLLARRRIFFKPLGRAPVMVTYNGVGTSLYGRGDVDAHDASYVATLFAVFFFVPVFPIGSYLVCDGERRGLRRSWTFMARVPLGSATYLWQRVAGIALVLVVLTGVARAFIGYGRNTLYVASGIARPLTVDLLATDAKSAAKPLTTSLPANGHVAIDLPIGHFAIGVRDGTRTIDSGNLEVSRRKGVTLWNVLGTAPVFVAPVVYTAGGADADGETPKTELLCGTSLVTRAPVDFLFQDPPQKMSMSSGQRSVTKTHLGIDEGGYAACAEGLAERGRAVEAARVAVAGVTAEQTTAADLPPGVESLLPELPPAEGEAFTRSLIARDDSVQAHRLHQDVLLAASLRDRAIQEYAARRDARPGDPDAEYLALRVQPIADAHDRIDAIVAKYPAHPFLRRSQLFLHYARREYADVVAAAEALRGLDPAGWRARSLGSHVEALLALGRGADAFALAQGVADDASLPTNVRNGGAGLARRVAHAANLPAPPPHRASTGAEAEASALLEAAASGEELSSAAIEVVRTQEMRDGLRISRAAQTNPATALDLAWQAGSEGLLFVGAPVRVLLLGEAVRQGKVERVPLFATGLLPKQQRDDAVAYLRSGAMTDAVAELPHELLAALEIGRSRAPGVSTEEASAARDRARADDVFRGPVSAAIAGWPR